MSPFLFAVLFVIRGYKTQSALLLKLYLEEGMDSYVSRWYFHVSESKESE